MKTHFWMLIALVAALGLLAAAPGSGSEPRAAKLAAALQDQDFSVVDAVRIAEQKTGGRALAAEVELEDGKAVVEVMVLTDAPALLEVEVDGASGKILEIEDADDDENDDGDEDGDEDGDD